MFKGKGSKKTKASRVTSDVPSKSEHDVHSVDETYEEGLLDPEDLEYFQDSDRNFAFLQEIKAE